jgi:hypothetical protein
MEIVNTAWDKGLEDAKSIFTESNLNYVRGLVDKTGTNIIKEGRKLGRGIKKEYRKAKPTIVKDAHHLRKAGKKDLNAAETTLNNIFNDTKSQLKVGSQYAKQSAIRAEQYVSGGMNLLRDDASAIVHAPGKWLDDAKSGVEGSLVTIAVIGGLLIYAFHDEIGTGLKYTGAGLKSAGKFVFDEAKAAAPYAPLLLV